MNYKFPCKYYLNFNEDRTGEKKSVINTTSSVVNMLKFIRFQCHFTTES